MTLAIEFGRARKDESVKVYIRVEHRGTRFRVNTHINLNKSEYYYGKTGYKIRNITKHSAIEGKVNKLRNKIIEEYGEYLVLCTRGRAFIYQNNKNMRKSAFDDKQNMRKSAFGDKQNMRKSAFLSKIIWGNDIFLLILPGILYRTSWKKEFSNVSSTAKCCSGRRKDRELRLYS